MSLRHPRLAREAAIVSAMIRLYCRGSHSIQPNQALCTECQTLQNYVNLRLERCPYQEEKPICANCPIHCYKPEMRQRIRDVMRYAGPRMIFRHPVMAIFHLVDGTRKPPMKKVARNRKN